MYGRAHQHAAGASFAMSQAPNPAVTGPARKAAQAGYFYASRYSEDVDLTKSETPTMAEFETQTFARP
jgi:hypothetical protein